MSGSHRGVPARIEETSIGDRCQEGAADGGADRNVSGLGPGSGTDLAAECREDGDRRTGPLPGSVDGSTLGGKTTWTLDVSAIITGYPITVSVIRREEEVLPLGPMAILSFVASHPSAALEPVAERQAVGGVRGCAVIELALRFSVPP